MSALAGAKNELINARCFERFVVFSLGSESDKNLNLATREVRASVEYELISRKNSSPMPEMVVHWINFIIKRMRRSIRTLLPGEEAKKSLKWYKTCLWSYRESCGGILSAGLSTGYLHKRTILNSVGTGGSWILACGDGSFVAPFRWTRFDFIALISILGLGSGGVTALPGLFTFSVCALVVRQPKHEVSGRIRRPAPGRTAIPKRAVDQLS